MWLFCFGSKLECNSLQNHIMKKKNLVITVAFNINSSHITKKREHILAWLTSDHISLQLRCGLGITC